MAREAFYRRYWERRKLLLKNRRFEVMDRWEITMSRGFLDYYENLPATLPERIIFNILHELGVNFAFAPYFGDIPWTERHEKYRPDFVLLDLQIIIEVVGVYWHTREGSYLRDYRRALWLEAAGFKVVTIPDDEILEDPYQAIWRAIPELGSVTGRGGRVVIGNRQSDPRASLQARMKKWARKTNIRSKPSTASRRGVLLSYQSAPSRINAVPPSSGPLFLSIDMDPELLQQYRDYGASWRKYLRQLQSFFGGSYSRRKEYKSRYTYLQRWRGWLGRYR